MPLLARRSLNGLPSNGRRAATAPSPPPAPRPAAAGRPCALLSVPAAPAAAAMTAASVAASGAWPTCRLSLALPRSRGLGQLGQARRRRGLAPLVCSTKQQYSSFDDMVARSELPLLVDFYATWCGPCQMMASTLSAVAAKTRGRLQVVKIDTDKYPAVASKHRVQALPTVALFVGGKMVFRFEGLLTEGQLLERLNYYLPPAGGAGTAAGGSAGAK